MNAMVQTERLFERAAASDHPIERVRSLSKDVYLLLFLPMSLVPAAMMMTGWTLYRESAWSHIPLEAAVVLAASLWFAELLLVPLLVEFVHVLRGRPDLATAHYDVEFLEAFAPTALMVSPLLLLVPRVFVYGILASAVAVGMMLFAGGYALGDPREAHARGLSWLVIDLGFIGWAAVMLFVVLI